MSDAGSSHVYVKVLMWMIPVIFGAGGVYASFSRTSSDIEQAKAQVEAAREEIKAHASEGVGHQVTGVRLERIEENQNRIMLEQRATARQLAAICQATKAQCQ